MKLYQRIAHLLQAIETCKQLPGGSPIANSTWVARHTALLDLLVREFLPRGSGFDLGTQLAGDSTPERLVFDTSFHHMNDVGMYDGWTSHQIIVTASLLSDFDLRIAGRNRNDIKDYIHECFQTALSKDIGVEEYAALALRAYGRVVA